MKCESCQKEIRDAQYDMWNQKIKICKDCLKRKKGVWINENSKATTTA